MLTASITLHRKSKDGKDGTSVTILSTKVLYQVSASPTDIPTSWVEDIKNAIQTDSKPYLWSKTIVAYSDNNKTVTFSVSYKGKDGTNGTSFTPKGMAYKYFNKASEIPSYTDELNGKIFLVDIADVSSPYNVPGEPYVSQYVLHNGEYHLAYEHAEFGDGYNVGGHLYVANSNEWVDFGAIQGAKGEQGDPGIDGKDAINIVFSPAELVFDADENGNLVQAEKSAEVKVFRGNKQLTYLTDWDNDAEIGDNCRAALLVNTTTNKPEVKISGITSSNIDDVKVPATSGGANVSVIVDGVKYRAYLPFSVNVNTYANFLIRDNKKYISKYTEVSNKYDAVSSELKNKADLKTVESTIEQTAENIKLEVLSKTSGRRNMLVNSAFRNQDSVFIHSLARIEKNTGVDGVNCIHSKDTYSGTGDGNYIGAFWDSTQKNGVVTNIPISKGKKYVISCWIKSDNKDLPFVIECFFMNSINQQNRGEDTVRKEYHVDNVNEWKRIDFVVDTTDTSEYASKVTPYLAVNFWSNNKNVPKAIGATDYPPCHAYICKPMMEEGDTYGGWTLSDSDYDYVGGNIIDNARTLEVGGSLKSINESNVADYSLAYYGDSMSLRINNTNAGSTPSIMTFSPSLEVGVDYMFSFLAKGTANIGLYALCDNSVDGDYLLSEDSVNAGVREIDTLKSRYAPIVLIPTQLTTEYKRYWGHMRFYGHVPTKLYLQLNNAGEVYICQPKLEIGATMTEFTERKTDLVDKASLKKAGIEITANQVKLYGDKVQVLTRIDGTPGYEEAGMFTNGKFNAKYIDAENIVVNGLQGKTIDAKKATITNLNVSNVKLTGTLRSPFTKANDSFDIGYSDNAAMPVEGGGWKTDYNLPWNVEQSGRRICLTNNLWDGETVFGTVSIDVPDKAKEYGCRFYENGIAKTELCFSSELIELMAYGNISAKNDNEPKSQYIYGWVVLNRVSLVPSRSKFGRQKKVLAYGKVEGTPTAAYIKYKTFDGSQDIRVTRNFVGTYVIYIPDNGWFSDKDDIFITLTGVGHCYDKNNVGSSPAKATVLDIAEVSSTYGGGFNIAIEVSDDETPNDGSFNFELSNFSDFDY